MIDVSIIIPVYNEEKFLHECLESVINQTLQNIEIICVDDGSTDQSPEILDEYACKDSRITVIHKQNTGYGDSMNTGLQLAQGEYIAIVESDDFAEKDMCEKLYTIAKNNDADCVKANYYEFSNNGRKLINAIDSFECEKVFTSKENLHKFNNQFICIWAGIYRKKFLLEKHISFLATPGASYQDLSFWFKVFVMADRCLFIKDAFLNYRVDNCNSSVKSRDKVFCVCDEMLECKRYLLNNGIMQDFLPYYSKLLFDVYQWNLERIAAKHIKIFIKTTYVDINDAIGNKSNELELFTRDEWNAVKMWADAPEKFINYTMRRRLEKSSKNMDFYLENLVEYIGNSKEIYIYGAGKVGRQIERLIHKVNKDCCINFLITDNVSYTVHSIDTLPIDINQKVIIAIEDWENSVYMSDCAYAYGFRNIFIIDDVIKQLLYRFHIER